MGPPRSPLAGGKKTPYLVAVNRGNPGRRRLTPPPDQEQSTADPPAWLDPIARDFWREMAPRLRATKCLPVVAEPGLAVLAHAWSLWRRSAAELGGPLLMRRRGQMSPKPELRVLYDAAAQIHRWSCEFGMTPASMQRLADLGLGASAPAADPGEAFFSGTAPGPAR